MCLKLCLLLLFCTAVYSSADDDIWCRNPQGEKVEWFLIYKTPKNVEVDGKANQSATGSEFGYFDSVLVNKAPYFVDGPDGVFSAANNPLAITLDPIFAKKDHSNLAYVVYNDQPPPSQADESSSGPSSGHTKGVVLFGQNTGVWLLHSVPHFPSGLFSGQYSYPETGREYGQSAMCVTFRTKDTLNTIATHLRHQGPNIYGSGAPSSMLSTYPDLDLLLKHKFSNEQPFMLKDTLTAIKGTNITAFAKHAKLDKDIYSYVIAQMLGTNLYVETWRNGGGGRLPPDCQDKFKVTDVEKISLKLGGRNLVFPSTHDHSKFAVGSEGYWVCIGSINRMLSQFKRGGETFCFENTLVHSLYATSIKDVAHCPIEP